MAIRAPFNFVPVSDKVFFPDWADQISHDIPFSDGVSGTINLKITAESPIFVRNGHTEKDSEEAKNSFSNIDGQYFIPGTSLKGAIRNVLEIMSFGKMNINKNAKFAQREWDNEKLYPLKKKQSEFFCGWLKRTGENYKIIDCGKPFRIGQTRIDEWIGEDIFRSVFSKDSKININSDIKVNGRTYDPKTAEYKYHLIGQRKLTGLSFMLDDEFCNEYKDNRLKVSSTGDIKGTIVLTGQPDKWMWPRPKKLTPGAGKFYEFVFEEKICGEIILSEAEFNHFKFIYSESTEWSRIKKEIDTEKGIPIFFRKENKKLKDFGIAYLFKLPYNYSAYDTLSPSHKVTESLDFAECIFGTVIKDRGLKGRVQIGNAISTLNAVHDELIFTMGSPKASYYPIYIKQKDGKKGIVGNYSTYNDSQIKGWKRYQIREQIQGNKQEYNETLDTKLIPLKKGAQFESKITFHNLKPIELAALISALTFHKTEGCFHQLGQGKPFGLGKTKIELKELNVDSSFDLELWLAKYEDVLSNQLKCDWHTHDAIAQLFTLAKIPVNASENSAFDYMRMSVKREQNEFATAKQFNEYLRSYSELKGQIVLPVSYLANYREQIQKNIELNEKQKKNEEARLRDEEIQKITTALEQSRIASNKIPLSEKIAKNDKFATIFGNVKTWMKLNEVEKLDNVDLEALISKLTDLYSRMKPNEQKAWSDFRKWSELSKVIGENAAKIVFDKLNS